MIKYEITYRARGDSMKKNVPHETDAEEKLLCHALKVLSDETRPTRGKAFSCRVYAAGFIQTPSGKQFLATHLDQIFECFSHQISPYLVDTGVNTGSAQKHMC
jgi:hypothetical protein